MKKFLIRLAGFLAIQFALLCFFVINGSRECSNEYMYALKDTKVTILIQRQTFF